MCVYFVCFFGFLFYFWVVALEDKPFYSICTDRLSSQSRIRNRMPEYLTGYGSLISKRPSIQPLGIPYSGYWQNGERASEHRDPVVGHPPGEQNQDQRPCHRTPAFRSQTADGAQGHNFSLLLFSMLMRHLSRKIQGCCDLVVIMDYTQTTWLSTVPISSRFSRPLHQASHGHIETPPDRLATRHALRFLAILAIYGYVWLYLAIPGYTWLYLIGSALSPACFWQQAFPYLGLLQSCNDSSFLDQVSQKCQNAALSSRRVNRISRIFCRPSQPAFVSST